MYIVIAGAGLIGGELSRELIDNKHDVIVIDHDKGVCDRLYAETGVVALCGSVAQIDVLKEAKLEKADVAVAATGSDADNLTFAILAKSLGVPQIVVRMRNPAYEKAYRVSGANTVVHVTDLMVSQMITEIEKPRVRRITSIGGGRADIYVVIVPKNARSAGKTVKDIAESQEFPSECVFVAVFNPEKEEFSIPRGNQVIDEGDELFLISTAGDIKQAADYLTAVRTAR